MDLLKSKSMSVGMALAALMALMALSQSASAGGECASLGGGCDDSGGWSGLAKLDEIGNTDAATETQTAAKWPEKSREQRWDMNAYGFEDEENGTANATQNETASSTAESSTSAKKAIAAAEEPAVIVRSDSAKVILAPLDSVIESDILLDVSENSTTHIAGSVVIPYMEFDVQAGFLKNVSEIAKILGDAGISAEDSVVIYGECLPCGGGPSVATYIYWMMKGLGHENVKVLDGTAEDWADSGRATTTDAAVLAGKVYTPAVTSNYTATYDFVKSGQAQIVDARTVQEYGSGSIPGSMNIPYASALEGRRITSEDQLKTVFKLLDKDQPVVVFTNTGMKATVVWFALEMMGYDARLYSYQDWVANQSS